MSRYLIADLSVSMTGISGKLKERAFPYLDSSHPADDSEADITITVTPERTAHFLPIIPGLSENECEYQWTGVEFYQKLILHHGIMLHASAISYQGKAFLFSAPSGTGKSTHTKLWQSAFGEENVTYINDDKPAIRILPQGIFVYGTPWSGKHDLSKNIGVPLGGICLLERAETNRIHRISPSEAIHPILTQTLRPPDENRMGGLLGVLDELLSHAKVFRMGCTISEDAARMAYEAMK